MKSFFDKMENVLDTYSETENGATAYKSSGKKLTDFNFKISYYRNHQDEALVNFYELLNSDESMETIARFIFYIGDIREGIGERETFKTCLGQFLKYIDTERAEKLLRLVPEYNRWDSVWKSVYNNEQLFSKALSIINTQIISDFQRAENDKSISLISKWLPSENASSENTKQMAKKIRKGLNLSSKAYRLLLSYLRKYLNIVEGKMSSNNWSEILYEQVPSKANLNYKTAFLRHDRERREAYIDSLKNGKTKINSEVLFPHEIVNKYSPYNYYSLKVKHYDEVYEQMWKSLPKLNIKNTLVVRDGSGSMLDYLVDNGHVSPLSIATALAVYFSENNTGEWKDKFITFSHNPEIVDLSKEETLMDKLNKCYKYDDCTNTDIYKTMKLILDTAVLNGVKQEDMPDMILIISDMQFDDHDFHMTGSLFDNIKNEFNKAGYKLPKICFWNVYDNSTNTIPLQENENGLILCSGFSINILKMFLSEEINPYQILLDTLYSERYNPVGEIFTM